MSFKSAPVHLPSFFFLSRRTESRLRWAQSQGAIMAQNRRLHSVPIGEQVDSAVGARPQHVEFVAAVRTHFDLPDLTGARMHRQTLRAAMSERIDLRLVSGLAKEWIVLRCGAVVA